MKAGEQQRGQARRKIQSTYRERETNMAKVLGANGEIQKRRLERKVRKMRVLDDLYLRQCVKETLVFLLRIT